MHAQARNLKADFNQEWERLWHQKTTDMDKVCVCVCVAFGVCAPAHTRVCSQRMLLNVRACARAPAVCYYKRMPCAAAPGTIQRTRAVMGPPALNQLLVVLACNACDGQTPGAMS